eukprot:11190750-Lingulodinium_polyedra.AAC.1
MRAQLREHAQAAGHGVPVPRGLAPTAAGSFHPGTAGTTAPMDVVATQAGATSGVLRLRQRRRRVGAV